MEVESPKLLSNIGLNNTNNNGELQDENPSSQDIINERFEQDRFNGIDNASDNESDDIKLNKQVTPTAGLSNDGNIIIENKNDNDYLNSKHESCFLDTDDNGEIANENSNLYEKCDNKEDEFRIENESNLSEEKLAEPSEGNGNIYVKPSFQISESSNSNISCDKKEDKDNKNDIIEFYHDSQWNPKNSDTYKNNVNDILTFSEDNPFLEKSPQILVENETIEDVKLVSSIEDSSPSSSSSKSSIVHLVEEKGEASVTCDKPHIEFSDDSSSNVNKNVSNINTSLSKEVNDSFSYNSLMIVDTKLDDENKENCSFQNNLENTNNNILGEDETLRNVEIVGSKVEKIFNESQKETYAINSNISETTTSSLTSSCLSEEKIEVIENQTESSIKCIQFETIAEEPYLTANDNNNITRYDEEKQDTDTLKDENKIESNAEECSEINISEHIHCLNKDGINDSKQSEVTFTETHSQFTSNTSEEIVSIIKRSPSDASDGNRKNILKHENSDAIDQFSDASQSSPNQKNHKSSTQHRVKFTEELPTKSTLQYNPALTSSPSQSSSSRMGGTSTGETTPNRHPGEQSHGQVKLGSEAQEFSEELPPQVMISGEEFPSKEANPFGTKIDSSYEGWDNPFRPEGEISHDAEELLRLWRLGKLEDQSRKNSQSCNNNDKSVTPKGTPKHTNGKVANSNNTDDASEPLLAQNGSHKNGVSPAAASTTNTSSTFEVKRETVGINQQPQHSQPVTINDKTRGDVTDSPKKKTDGCCSIM